MVVAARTQKTHAHPYLRGGSDAIDDVLGAVFLWNDAALDSDGVIAIEAGGHFLLQRGLWQQVPGKLLDGELIKRQIAVVGVDHPIAPRPHVTVGVVLITVGVGVAGGVEPVAGHVLAIPWRGQQAVDGFLKCLGRLVGDEGIQFF